jgi:NTE family protein
MTVDLRTRHRVPLGRDPADRRHPLDMAIMASCTVPGFYEPVRLGNRLLVDGGIRSSTSIDYAVRHGSSRVVAIVPLGWEVPGRPRLRHRLIRRSTVTGTRRELARAGDRARDVLVIQPMAEDVEQHGSNIMRTTGLDAVAELAYARTLTALRAPTMDHFLGGLQHRLD